MRFIEHRLQLTYQRPLHIPSLLGHLAATMVPGVEQWVDGGLLRTLVLPEGPALMHIFASDPIRVHIWLPSDADIDGVQCLIRQWLDLDADPDAIESALTQDHELAPMLAATPGVRLPGGPDPVEMAFRVVLGQQISTKAASTLGSRFVDLAGQSLPRELVAMVPGAPTKHFPSAAALSRIKSEQYPGMPGARRETMHRLADALVEGEVVLDRSRPTALMRDELSALKGIGPWTVEMIALRALGDADAFPHTDLGVLVGARKAGLPGSPRELLAHSHRWSPVRSYVTQLLWASTAHEAARLPVNRSVSWRGESKPR